MDKKKYLKITWIIIIISTSFFAVLLGCEEGKNMISESWEIEEFKVNGTDKKKEFKIGILIKTPEITIIENGDLILPMFEEYNSTKGIKAWDEWNYIRKGFGEGQIEIIDLHQNYFSGIYDIEVLDYSRPKLIRLYSDSIEFILREQSFSLKNPIISH